jgi:hypothetical protein
VVDEEVECSADAEAAMSQEDSFMFNLLSDVEEVIDELYHSNIANEINCIWCGAGRGQRHDDSCFYVTTLKRLTAEVDTFSNKTGV